MNSPQLLPMSRAALVALLWLAAQPGIPAEADQSPIVVRAIDATPTVLEESGICLEGRRNSSGLDLTIYIPVTNSAGRVTDFYIKVLQGTGRSTETSMLFSAYSGEWTSPVHVNLWSLSNLENEVIMQVGYRNPSTGNGIRYRFSSVTLRRLLAIDNSDRIFRAGCKRWDSENAGRETGR